MNQSLASSQAYSLVVVYVVELHYSSTVHTLNYSEYSTTVLATITAQTNLPLVLVIVVSYDVQEKGKQILQSDTMRIENSTLFNSSRQ
jgi:hypothetical protein